MQYTPLMAEFQVTQEYLGHSNHLAYLAPMWKEFFNFVAPASLKAIACVANIGTDVNWCGHTFAQANWYACLARSASEGLYTKARHMTMPL